MEEFIRLGVDNKLLKAISEKGFVTPTSVQEQVIPLLLGNQGDVVVLSQTGTGKTAAFGLPILQKTKKKKYTQTLILSPTRELCMQISKDLKDYGKYKEWIGVVAVYGGASIEKQARELRNNAHIVVATPGRLLDMVNRGMVDISKIENFILDEADEMLNMGFKDELDSILESAPSQRNTLLFSATMPKEVEAIAKNYMNDAQRIVIGQRNTGSEDVEHHYFCVKARDRYLALKRISDFNPGMYAIIFCRTRKETQEVADKLIEDGYNADSLHGDLSQAQRDYVMYKFRLKHLQMLVATDVAARGLDVHNLTHIINYNLPDDIEQYTHRSGRTGRAGKKGVCISIINLKEKSKIKRIEKVIKREFIKKDIPDGREICKKQLLNMIDRMRCVEINEEEMATFLPEVNKKLKDLSKEQIIKGFVSLEFNKFLSYYKDSQDINAKEEKGRKREFNSKDMVRFFINLGHMDRLKPQDIIGLVNDFTQRKDINVGKIEILKNFSFFEVEKEKAKLLLKSFKKQSYKGRKLRLEEAELKKSDNKGSKQKGRKKQKKNIRFK